MPLFSLLFDFLCGEKKTQTTEYKKREKKKIQPFRSNFSDSCAYSIYLLFRLYTAYQTRFKSSPESVRFMHTLRNLCRTLIHAYLRNLRNLGLAGIKTESNPFTAPTILLQIGLLEVGNF